MAINKSIFLYEERHNSVFPDLPIKVLYRIDKYIYFDTEFGICKKLYYKFGISSYNIDSAINKTEYLKKVLTKNYGNRYNYDLVEWVNSKTKIHLICKIHGDCFIETNSLLQNLGGCKKCGSIKLSNTKSLNIKEFIKISNVVHNSFYNYKDSIYDRSFKKIAIICPIHGKFKQKANNHLQGFGCKKCANIKVGKINANNTPGWNLDSWVNKAKNSKCFNSFKIYIIKCWNNEEEFYKIGRTFNTIHNRFKSNMPYKYEIVKIYEDTAENIYNMETELKRKFKNKKYMPNKKFSGMQECFKFENQWLESLFMGVNNI
jgi:hypothetical protein